jgi:ABC-type transporter Mla subunit MlaD
MMNSDKKHIIVGLFVLGGLVLLALLVIWFQGLAIMLRGGYVVSGHLTTSTGVRAGKRVLMDGLEVGEVREVVTSLPGRPGVWVRMRIAPDIRIPLEARLIAQQSAVGDVSLDFQTTRTPTGYLPTDGLAAIDGVIQSPALLPEDLVAKFNKVLDQFNGAGDLVPKFGKALDQLGGAGDLIKNLTDLTAPRTLKDVAAGKPKNLSTALEQFQDSAEGIKDFLQDAETKKLFASASKAADDLSKTLEDARQAIDAFKTTADTYTEAGKKADAMVVKGTEMISKFGKDADAAQKVIENMDGIVNDLRAGKGSLGQLIANDELHRDLTNLAENLNTMTQNANKLIIMWRHEGIMAKEGK